MASTVKIKQFKNKKKEPVAGLTPEHAIYDANGVRLDAKLGNVNLQEFRDLQQQSVNKIKEQQDTTETYIDNKVVSAKAEIDAKHEEVAQLTQASMIGSSAVGLEGSNVEEKLTSAGGKLSELEEKISQKAEGSLDTQGWLRIEINIDAGKNYLIRKGYGITTTIAITNSDTSTASDVRLQTICTDNFSGKITFQALVDAKYLIIYCANAVDVEISVANTLESKIQGNTDSIDSITPIVESNGIKIKELRNRAYFHNLQKPLFYLTGNSNIDVTIPNADLRIYKESTIVYIDKIAETTYSIPNTHALIVRDKTFIVVSSNDVAIQDYILVENTGGCISGLLSHYFNTETREILNNTNENVTENTLAIGLHDEKTITSDWAVLTGPIIAGKEYTIKTSSICGAVYYLNSNIHDTSKRGSKIADSVRYEYKFVATENASHIEVFVNEGSVSLDFFGLKQVTYELENKMDSLVGEENSINLSASTTEWLISEYKFVKGKRYKINCVSGRTTTIVLLDTNSPTQEHRVQTIATSLISGEYVLFTAEVNAPYIGVYVVGNVELKVQKYNTIQELTEKCSSIEDSIAPIISAISPKDIAAYYATKKGYIKNVEKESDFNCLFFSDVHGNSGLQRNTQRLFELADSIDGLNAVINGGDTGWGIIADAQGWYNALENNCSKDILNCIGNHDLWTDRGSWSWAEVPTLTYQIFISNMLNRVSDIVQPNEASESKPLLYYYKDYNNVRVIVLNALSTQVSPYYWTEEQKVWLKSVLTDAKNNSKNVIIVNHYPMSKSNADIVQGSRWTEYDNIITGINDRQEAPEELFSIVHEFISNGGKFICYLTGHKHSDNLLTHKLYPEQLMINIASAKNVNHSTGYMANDESEKEFDCANYIGVDITHSLIKVYRIGWNRDLSMIARNTLCYDYANMSVVFED